MKGEQENAISGKQLDIVQKEILAASATAVIVERKQNRPLPIRDRRHKKTEENLRKETHPGEVVHPERSVQNRARITSKDIVRVRRVIIDVSEIRN